MRLDWRLSMPVSRRALVRGSVIGAVVLMGAALLATAFASWTDTRAASSTLVRGQADTLQEAVRGALAELDGPPTNADLAGILDELSGDGLRYLAVSDMTGAVGAEAGTPVVRAS